MYFWYESYMGGLLEALVSIYSKSIVWKWINTPNLQVITIGPGKDWGDVVVPIPAKHTNNQPVMELVAFTRVVWKESFNIWDNDLNSITVEDLKEISQSKYYDEHRNLENLLW